MVRASRKNHIWRRWENREQSSWDHWIVKSNDFRDEEIRIEPIGRRQCKMLPRINLEKWDDVDFVCRFRLEKRTTLLVLDLIKDSLPYDKRRSRELRPITKLLIFLRYCALGSIQLAVSDFSGVCRSTTHRVLKQVGTALAQLSHQYIQMPTNDTPNELRKVALEFFQISKFPRTIGAIDCTHIKIQSPGGAHAENYRNRKTWFSLNVQTVCDAKLRILDIVARWPGASHDQHIFHRSNLKKRFDGGEFGHFIIVGDSGYKNTEYLATPFLDCAPGSVQSLYNEAQIRTRNVVERSYGVWKRRFPVLATGMRCHLNTVQIIIVACAVLHNIALDQRDISAEPPPIPGFDDMLALTTFDTVHARRSQSSHNTEDNTARARLIHQFFEPLMMGQEYIYQE